MPDIQSTYSLTLKNGLFYKKDGTAFHKPNGCNLVKSKLQKDGYKAVLVAVEGGYALRIHDLDKGANAATSGAERPDTAEAGGSEKPAEGGTEKSIDDLRKEVEELQERRRLEQKLAELKGETNEGGNGAEPTLSRGSAPANRPKRKPFQRNRLKFPERPGYRRRVFNDSDGGRRILDAQEAGWMVVADPLAAVDSDGDVNRASQFGSAVSRHVGTDESSKPMRGVLMEIPEEWYREAQDEKQTAIDRGEEGLRRMNKDGVTGGLKVHATADE